MGEILRAILDQTSIYSGPAFYSVGITQVSTGPLARALVRRQGTLQCKTDTWFLLMGWTQDIAIGAAAPPFWDAKTFPTAFLVQDLKTTETYFGPAGQPVVHSNAGYNCNNIITLPEYILWPPNALIGVSMDVPLQNTVAPVTDQTFVTLTGIEYRMPPGKDY